MDHSNHQNYSCTFLINKHSEE